MLVVDVVLELARVLLRPARSPELVLARFHTPLMPEERLSLECDISPAAAELTASGSILGRDFCTIAVRCADQGGADDA
jgi:hypothetical protein